MTSLFSQLKKGQLWKISIEWRKGSSTEIHYHHSGVYEVVCETSSGVMLRTKEERVISGGAVLDVVLDDLNQFIPLCDMDHAKIGNVYEKVKTKRSGTHMFNMRETWELIGEDKFPKGTHWRYEKTALSSETLAQEYKEVRMVTSAGYSGGFWHFTDTAEESFMIPNNIVDSFVKHDNGYTGCLRAEKIIGITFSRDEC